MTAPAILVVDSHRLYAEAIAAACVAAGAPSVAITPSVRAALKAAREQRPDLVIVTSASARRRPATIDALTTRLGEAAVLVIDPHEPIARVLAGARDIGRLHAERAGPPAETPSAAAAFKLTPREVEVLGLVAAGLTNQAIAERLFVSIHTIRNHVASINGKLGTRSKLEAAAMATRHGLVG